ncbi:hypothetical protein C8J55DRAFT_403772, partial [Lentinula edodes]
GTRQIRNSDIVEIDFKVLIDGGKRLHSSLLNAITAQIQSEAEVAGESPEFCVFSSWLGPLIDGTHKENALTGTVDMHIAQAVS